MESDWLGSQCKRISREDSYCHGRDSEGHANVGSGIQNAINSPTVANIANLAKGAGVGVLISGFGDLGNPEAGTPMDERARMESQKAFLKANPSFNPKEQKLQPHWNGGGFDFTIVDRKSTALGPKS